MKKLQQPKTDDRPWRRLTPSAPTTWKGVHLVPEEKLPPVQGVAGYKPLKDNTAAMAPNVWRLCRSSTPQRRYEARASGSLATARSSSSSSCSSTILWLRDAYARARNVHIGWPRWIMLPLFKEELKATRARARVSSRSTGPTAAMALWRRTASLTFRSCAARPWCWPRTPQPILRPQRSHIINGGVQPAEELAHVQRLRGRGGLQRRQEDRRLRVVGADIYNLPRCLVTSSSVPRRGQPPHRRRVRPRRLR